MAEGVCPKTQDTRGMSTLVSSCATRHVPYRSRQGIFPRFSRSRRVFPRSEIFVCLRFISHIVDVESFLRFNNFEQRIFPRIFNVFSIILDFIPCLRIMIESISSRMKPRNEKEKKK